NLLGYAEDAAKMGVAFDMAAGDAGTAMATMANVLGKPISEMAKFGDAINHLSDNANAKAADIVNVIARAGSD
ncbi:phage tail tape measure protein, partial [Stenotrophomonas maltophilia]